ncbi:MAG: ribosomal RNA small subunit methyltransferase A, partial [Kiritimatiellae bacterium]|nr:ribosomal RNA small subunit methyltransferase A [Kiritimatiellia bacterium]
CIEHDFHPNKTMGQNFLIDRNALVAIVDAGLDGVPAGAPVLEIGPGLGVLTEEMVARGHPVVAIEKDPVLADRLAAAGIAGLTVLTGDALDPRVRAAAHEKLLASSDAARLTMVSNLPYQAGTRILLELVRQRALARMTVLVQTEVAERLAAKEGSKVRGLAGVWAQLDYDVAIVRKVAASCFWPRPAIGSTVVTLVRHDRNAALTDAERDLFHRLTKQAFEHRRKQLGTIFKDMIQSTARAEELANDDWINLVKGLIENEDT